MKMQHYYPDQLPDGRQFTLQNISFIIFSNMDLSWYVFDRCIMRRVIFYECNLRGSLFRHSHHDGVVFDRCDLNAAKISEPITGKRHIYDECTTEIKECNLTEGGLELEYLNLDTILFDQEDPEIFENISTLGCYPDSHALLR